MNNIAENNIKSNNKNILKKNAKTMIAFIDRIPKYHKNNPEFKSIFFRGIFTILEKLGTNEKLIKIRKIIFNLIKFNSEIFTEKILKMKPKTNDNDIYEAKCNVENIFNELISCEERNLFICVKIKMDILALEEFEKEAKYYYADCFDYYDSDLSFIILEIDKFLSDDIKPFFHRGLYVIHRILQDNSENNNLQNKIYQCQMKFYDHKIYDGNKTTVKNLNHFNFIKFFYKYIKNMIINFDSDARFLENSLISPKHFLLNEILEFPTFCENFLYLSGTNSYNIYEEKQISTFIELILFKMEKYIPLIHSLITTT